MLRLGTAVLLGCLVALSCRSGAAPCFRIHPATRNMCTAAGKVASWEQQGRIRGISRAKAICSISVVAGSAVPRESRNIPFFVAVLMPPGAMCAVSAQEEQESVLARAYFRWSAEGWNATTKDGERVRLGHREI